MSALLKSEVYGDNYREKEEIFTEAEYLAIEKNSEKKLEFIDGKIYSMAGASFNHGIIATNLDRKLWLHLEDNPCSVYREFLKIKRDTNYFIPDVIVDCNEEQDSIFSENAILIVEVLSPSTSYNDLGIKFDYYQQIKTLQEYVVIEQDSMCVDVYRRQDNWDGERYLEGSDVKFQSISLTIPIEDIYKGAKFKRKIRKYNGLVLRR